MNVRIKNQIIQALANGRTSVYRLIDRQDASLPEFLSIIDEMKKEGMISIEGGIVSLAEDNETITKLQNTGVTECSECDYTGYSISGFFSEILEKFEEIASERPEAIEVYDQGFISPEGIIKRIMFMHDRGDLLDSEIFIVGDDDLLSIAAALTGLPKRVRVGEIDERLVSFINRVGEAFNLPIEAVKFDVQHPLPANLRRKFDVFVMDPVETLPGLGLFLSRGVLSLKGIGCSGYFGITTLEASRKKWYEIERMIYEMGFVITDLRRKFSIYPLTEKNFLSYHEKLPVYDKFGDNVDCDWYKSTLYRIEAVKEPVPVVEGEMVIDEKVYKDDESWATPY